VPRLTARPKEGLPDLGAALLDAFPVGLYLVDRDLRVVAWNTLREKGPLGLPREKVLGQPLKKLIPPAGYRMTSMIFQEIFRTGKIYEEMTEASGRLFHIRRLPVRQGRGVTHVLSWFEDVTEKRALEMRLIASDRLAFLGQLVAGVAHEVSNPLAGIAGCAEALSSLAVRTSGKEKREARRFRDLIREEVQRCERIVSFLLDSARPSAGRTADIPDTVGTTLRLVERHPAFTRIRVKARIPEALPAAHIETDSLKQVMMALAMNASRAMPTGGTLTIQASHRGRQLILDVIDTGPGVPQAARPYMFEPFTNDSGRRPGLGLAVARSVLRSHGGDLMYVPRRQGSCFRVVIRTAGGRAA
jgi:PAS domain S-box-containing protein